MDYAIYRLGVLLINLIQDAKVNISPYIWMPSKLIRTADDLMDIGVLVRMLLLRREKSAWTLGAPVEMIIKIHGKENNNRRSVIRSFYSCV